MLDYADLLPGTDISKPDFWSSGWYWGFSTKTLFVECIEEYDARLEEGKRMDDLTWIEAKALFKKWNDETERSPNPLTKSITPTLLMGEESSREARARLRVLRAAMHWRATGEVPNLEDPFGDRIHHAKTTTTLKIWSVGSDGVDNGGDGLEGTDIVIELEIDGGAGEDP